MGTGIYKLMIRGLVALVLALLTCVGRDAQSAGYLASLGPAPLRFQSYPTTESEQKAAILPPLGQNDNDIVTSNQSLNPQPTVRAVNEDRESILFIRDRILELGPSLEQLLSYLSLMDLRALPVFPASSLNNGTQVNTVVGSASANDLLVVTPQMLVDYFKPNRNSTNGANATVIVPVGFRPPAAQPASSEATYQSR